jgi:hypothetical protein
MNERIRELAKRCYETGPIGRDGWPEYTRFNEEQFAKLVVEECIQVGGPEDSYTDQWFAAKADSVNKIKQHFGID